VPEGLFILSLDISDRKRSEMEKREHLHKLEEMMFITSHRVRQPVAHILGISNLLDDPENTPKEVQEMLGHIRGSAQALDELTRELIYFIHDMKIKARERNWA